jgi:hypothetical protein
MGMGNGEGNGNMCNMLFLQVLHAILKTMQWKGFPPWMHTGWEEIAIMTGPW